MSELLAIRLLDIVLSCAHGLLALFNLFGWMWRPARRLHIVTLGLTLLSWFGLGLVFGWGYCPLTDLQWRVKWALGERTLPTSWIEYVLEASTGIDWSASLVDLLVVGVSVLAFALSLTLHVRDRRCLDRRQGAWAGSRRG